MILFQAFYPKEYVDSTYGIDFEGLYRRGFRGILFDVDNTLVPHGAPATAQSVELFQRLHEMGFATCLISNNKEPRVRPFADAMETPFVYKAVSYTHLHRMLCIVLCRTGVPLPCLLKTTR